MPLFQPIYTWSKLQLTRETPRWPWRLLDPAEAYCRTHADQDAAAREASAVWLRRLTLIDGLRRRTITRVSTLIP